MRKWLHVHALHHQRHLPSGMGVVRAVAWLAVISSGVRSLPNKIKSIAYQHFPPNYNCLAPVKHTTAYPATCTPHPASLLQLAFVRSAVVVVVFVCIRWWRLKLPSRQCQNQVGFLARQLLPNFILQSNCWHLFFWHGNARKGGLWGRAHVYVEFVGMAVTCFSIVYPSQAGQASVSGGNCYGSTVMFDCIAMGLLNFCDFRLERNQIPCTVPSQQ